jgi:hypothetical protein
VNTCDDQALDFGKEEREKTKWAQGKGDINRAILFLVIKTPSECDYV